MCSSTSAVRATRSPRRARAASRSEWPVPCARAGADAGAAAATRAVAARRAIVPRMWLLRLVVPKVSPGRAGRANPGRSRVDGLAPLGILPFVLPLIPARRARRLGATPISEGRNYGSPQRAASRGAARRLGPAEREHPSRDILDRLTPNWTSWSLRSSLARRRRVPRDPARRLRVSAELSSRRRGTIET